MAKRLIVNADDFGFTRDVNAGIVHAHREGILTATTLMANGDAFDDAIRLAQETPSLDIGCHLVLVQGRSLLTGKPFPETLTEFLPLVFRKQIDIYAELSTQIEKVRDAGIVPTHLDTHKHTHLLPAVFRVVVELARKYDIPFVRLPVDTTLPLALAVRPFYQRMIGMASVRTTDHFLGFRLTGSFTEETFAKALRKLPDGLTEFMCHPGWLGPELQKAHTRLKESRLRELEALISPRIRALLSDEAIRICPYKGN